MSQISAEARAGSLPLSSEAQKVLRNTYLLLAFTLLPTIVGAAIGVAYPYMAYTGPLVGMLIFFGVAFGLMIAVQANRNSMMGVNFLLLFSLAMGYFLGPLLAIALTFSNGVDLIAMAFGGTALTFFALAAYASTTSRDFTAPGIGKTVFIGLICCVIASVVAVLFGMPMLSMAVSAIIIPICAVFIVITLNSIVRGGETNYISATLSVYVMLYNIFTSLLQLLLVFAGNRE